MFERRVFRHLDWALATAVFVLAAIGVAMIYSTTGGSRPAAPLRGCT